MKPIEQALQFLEACASCWIGRQPPRWMVAGDVVRVEIDGLGVLENPIVEEPEGTALR